MGKIIRKIRNTELFTGNVQLLAIIKKIVICIARIITLGRGIRKRIGNDPIPYVFDYNFIFASYTDWGTKHNEGFYKLLEVSKGCKTVFDIGAHIGLCSLPLSRVIHREGIIYAFEPSAVNAKFLKKNVEFNNIRNIEIIPHLVGEKSANSILYYESFNVSGMNSLADYKIDETYQAVNREQVSIDDFCADNDLEPEIIKIDVEGAEIKVLRGMKNTVASCSPRIVLSVHPKQLEILSHSVDELLTVINEIRYKAHEISGEPAETLSFSEYLLLPL